MKTVRFKQLIRERNEFSRSGEETLLSVSEYYGVKPRSEAFEGEEYESRAESLEGYRIVRNGDLVMNYMLAWKGAYGLSRHDGIVSPAYAVFKVDKDAQLDTRFLHHRLRSDDMRAAFRSRSKGIIESRLRLYPDAFLAMSVDLPDLPVQRQIADFLDRETARIDLLIEKKWRLLQGAEEEHTARSTRMVLGDTAWHGDFRVWASIAPTGWRACFLKSLISAERHITYGIVQPGQPSPEGVLMVRGQDYSRGWATPDTVFRVSRDVEEPYRRARLKAGDIVMTIVGAGVGNVAVVPVQYEGANITQTTARLAVDPRKADPEYVVAALSSKIGSYNVEIFKRGAAQPGLMLKDVARFQLPLPPREQQVSIAQRTKASRERLDGLRLRIRASTDRLREYRSALITAAVTGQIDPATWRRSGDGDRRLETLAEEVDA